MDASVRTKKDPDCFTLSKSKYEINKCYLDLIAKSLEKNGGLFDSDVVIDNDKANYRLTKGSLKRLGPGKWFNDEIINGYVNLINERDKEFGAGSVFCFNTYFYTMIEDMLKRGDYEFKRLERVLIRKNVNLKNFKMIMVPINIEKSHWFLLCLDLVDDKFLVIDSMHSSLERANQFVGTFKKFFQDYLRSNKSGRMKCEDNLDLWATEVPKIIPRQPNGFDCGLCLCLNMESLSRAPKVSEIRYELNADFSEESRKRMTVELMFGKLLTEMST